MEIKTIKYVELFKDLKMTDSWCKDSIMNSKGYDIEFKGNKARVLCRNPFSKPSSRFNKLTPIGSWGNKRGYQLIVEGKKVFFIVGYHLPK